MLTPDAIRDRLDALRQERGYVLPHHGALLAAAPDLHAAYGAMYRALTLTQRHLDPFTKEFVWLTLLVALKEEVGTHHVNLFRQAGGTAAQARLAVQLAGYAAAADGFAFVEHHWQHDLPGVGDASGYLDGLDALRGDTVPVLAGHLALLAVHAAQQRDWGVATHLHAAYDSGVPEDAMVEALSLVIWPAGVNPFLRACTVWHDAMRAGRVSPSPRYKAWADAPGQGRFVQAPQP